MQLIKIICLTTLTMFVCSDLSAQDEKGKRRDRQANQQRGNIMQLLKRLDTNGDKSLTTDEIPDRIAERMARLDLDGNGVIDESEIRKIAERLKGMRGGDQGQGKRKRRSRPDAGPGSEGNEKMKGKKKGKARGKGKGKGKADGNNENARKGKKRDAMGEKEFLAGIMRRFDKNNDQAISKDEAPERLQNNWDRIDQNGDDILDMEELKSLAKMAQRRDGNDKAKRKRKREGGSDGKPRGGVKPKRPGSDG